MTRLIFLLTFLAMGCQCGPSTTPPKPTTEEPAEQKVDWPALSSDPDEARKQIIERLEKEKGAVVVIHLDDQVLMDRLPRIQRIFTEVMYEAKRQPLMQKAMRSADHGLKLRSPEAFIEYLGITEEDPLLKLVQRRLKERLVSDAYLSDDEQRPGSSAFIQEIHGTGAQIVYISSLDFIRSGVGLTRALRVNGYPALGARSHLMMRYDADQSVDDASKQQLKTIESLGPVAVVFSQSGLLMKDAFPNAYSVCVLEPGSEDPNDSCWSRWSAPPPAARVEPNPGVGKELRPLGPPSENSTPLDAGP
ncbi:MAG: hypothetical protein CMH50_08955 [Myxococcales bacterium]|jgi:hypothetical protein|nr:hypothetical protein [Myxococcales bacterium]